MPNKLIWNHTSDGMFTVRSAYIVALKVLDQNLGGTQGDVVWKSIWTSKVVPKIKDFHVECTFSKQVWDELGPWVWQFINGMVNSQDVLKKLINEAELKGAFRAGDNKAGLGVVAKDHSGSVCFFAFKKIEFPEDSFIAEVLAIKFGLEAAVDNNSISWCWLIG
ncbi:hypothetical protein REPUB_Repub19eG0116100 [Reevesia pubescens]